MSPANIIQGHKVCAGCFGFAIAAGAHTNQLYLPGPGETCDRCHQTPEVQETENVGHRQDQGTHPEAAQPR